MFSPPIVNEYVNQLEALKRDGKENSKDAEDILDKYNDIDKIIIDFKFSEIDIDNSWLLKCIGDYYIFEEGDYLKGIDLHMKSAKLNNSYAMYSIGYYYDVKEEYPEAKEWYIKSANLGNNWAMYYLGSYYCNIEKNYKKAIDWVIKSSNLGNENAIYFLKIINIDKELYDYIFELSQKCEEEKTKETLLNRLPSSYVYDKMLKENNYLKSIKNQGIDKVLINSIFKHF